MRQEPYFQVARPSSCIGEIVYNHTCQKSSTDRTGSQQQIARGGGVGGREKSTWGDSNPEPCWLTPGVVPTLQGWGILSKEQ